MTEEGQRPEDLPWNDSPADAGLPAEVEEPEPAEVEGDEDDDAVEDRSTARIPTADDEYRRDTLDERLAEEEPDRQITGPPEAEEAGDLVDPQRGGGDVQRGEPHSAGDDPLAGEGAAEEAAIHLVDDDRVLRDPDV